MKYQAYFFDADNTLLDFQKASNKSFSNVLKNLEITENHDKIYTSFKEISNELWIQYENSEISRNFLKEQRFLRTFSKHQIPLSPSHASALFLKGIEDYVPLIENSLEICKIIKKRNRTLGIITNGIREVQFKRFSKTSLNPYIDFNIVVDEDMTPKPHSSMFLKALKLAKYPKPKDCLMIGDNLKTDILGANQVNMPSAWFNPSQKPPHPQIKPTYTISNLLDLLDL